MCEQVAYTMGKRYADIMKTMWFTFLYCSCIPLGTLWSMVGLMIYYNADKCNVVKWRTIKDMIGSDLSNSMIENLEISIFLHCFG